MPGDRNRFAGLIEAGLARLATFQHDNGLFSIWCGGTPGLDITARVAHRLLGLRGLPFPAAEKMLNRTRDALLKHSHRDNQLLPLDRRFRDKLRSVEDAVALYFHADGERDKVLDYLRRHAEREDGRIHWPAKSAWGGVLEVTCDATRVMYAAGDPLFRPGFHFVASKLVDGRLYSTADTRALVELLAALRLPPAATAQIDGHEVPLSEVTSGREVTALNDGLIVRVDEMVTINHLTPRADFRFEVRPTKTRLKLGERIQIAVKPQEESIAPLARLYLPGCLALLKAGANAQTAYLPIETNELVVDAVAVRPGRGRLYVAVHDMYDSEKVGTAPGIEMQVVA